MRLLFAGESRRLATLILAAKRPLLAESSHSNPSIVGVASVRYTPKAATQMLESGLN